MTNAIRLHSIECLSERNEESASEEPYVVVTAVDMRPPMPGVPAAPNYHVTRYGVWDSFDQADVVIDGSAPFWSGV